MTKETASGLCKTPLSWCTQENNEMSVRGGSEAPRRGCLWYSREFEPGAAVVEHGETNRDAKRGAGARNQ